MSSRYHEVYRSWRADPQGFWREASAAVEWVRPPTTIFAPDAGVWGRWFPDASCNTCFNALDRHVLAGRGATVAMIHDSPVTGVVRKLTYAALLDEVATLAAVLADLGVAKGDRVVLYMPMVLEAVVGMLACARLGAIHSVVFGGFAANELSKRIDDARPKVVLWASCGIEASRIVPYKPLLDAALAASSHEPEACLVLARPQCAASLVPGRDIDWAQAVATARGVGRTEPCVPVAATDPLYILYTSGTTGVPKGVVRDNGGTLVPLAWTMPNLYDARPGDVFWCASDVGWVVGHCYIVYAPLIAGITSVLYEGKPVGTPDAGAFWRVCAEHGVSTLFTAPTALRAIRKEDPEAALVAGHDLSRFRALFLAGERCDPDTLHWAERVLGVPVIDHWWQTETGWCIAGNPLGLGALPVKAGSPTVPMPGYALDVVDEAGRSVPAGTMGSIVIRMPLPPGALPTLWGDDARMRASYLDEFPGCYATSDAGLIDPDGYLFVMGRTDDIINVAGHRLSTGGMEEVLASHPDVAECAVIGRRDAIKGEAPLGFVVLKNGSAREPGAVAAELVALVRERIGPVASFREAVTVARLPKTRSGKILRATMKKLADGDPWSVPPTIDDPAILDEIAAVLAVTG